MLITEEKLQEKLDRLDLVDLEGEYIAQGKALTEYIISDLEGLLGNQFTYKPVEQVNRCLTALTMLLNRFDSIKEISEKRFLLDKREVA